MASDSHSYVKRLAFWGIPLAFFVMGLKLLAWWVTGSVALLSDALESTVNVVAAIIAWLAIGYAARPADESHPFGHHKAEYVSAVVEGVLIVLAALLIVREAHDICDRIEEAIETALPGARVAIHVEPETERAHGVRVTVEETSK